METICIEYAAISHRGGFVPAVRTNCEPWAWLRRNPVSREQAIAEARASATDDASRYAGDWNVQVVEAGARQAA
jgi:hypothetical protein